MTNLSDITKIKILILKNGVKFSPINLFNKFPNIDIYKTKTINKNPVTNGKEVFDVSNDTTIIPSEILLKSENRVSLVKCRFNCNSPVELGFENNNFIIKLDNKLSKVGVELVPKHSILQQKIDDDHQVGDYIDIVGLDRISILLFEGCYNWVCGKQCKFCDLHPKKATDKVCKPTINTLHKFENVDEWWNYYKQEYFKNLKLALDVVLEKANLKHKHLLIMAGNLTNSEMAWKCLLELTEFLSKNYDMSIFDSYANVCPHPNIESLKQLKKYGVKQVQYNLEVSNAELFSQLCPGKIDFEQFKQKLFEAVDVFGKGNVRSNMVLGLQDISELLSDTKYFASKGIVFDYSVFQPKKHTPLENHPAPDMNDVIDYTIELAKIYKTHKFNPIYCELSSRSSIINEVFLDVDNSSV